MISCSNYACKYITDDRPPLRSHCFLSRVVITETGECETYWLSVARGESKDIRDDEYRHLVPLFTKGGE